MLRSVLVAAALAACSQPAAPPATVASPTPAPSPAVTTVPVDAPEASQEERLAAIQKAMNELDEAAQGCWAAAATDRFDIEGELALMIEIAATSAKAQVVTDTARNQKLARCVVTLLEAYRWAPPLHGQTIQLPFKFRAPDGQSVIDRRLVEWHGQGKVSLAVLIDENNTGNAAASVFELAIEKGGGTGWRRADRSELWYFLGPALVTNLPSAKHESRTVDAGDMMFVPAGAIRDVRANTADVHAVIVVVPGGREGTARAGALPTPDVTPAKQPVGQVLAAASAKTFGPATIFVEPATMKGAPLAASILKLAANANVPEHVHAKETEVLYVLEGSGTMTVAGTPVAVTPTSVIQIPPNTKHAFTATSDVRAVQIYTPAGPEQRFKKKP